MIFNSTKYCRNCVYRGQLQNGNWLCRLTNLPINLEMDFCSKASSEGTVCDNCHSLIPKGIESFVISRDDGGYLVLCGNCYNRS